MSPLLEALWRATWQGGLFIAAVFVITRLFRKMSASARYWLWWLACLQLPLRMALQVPIILPAQALPPRVVAPANAEPEPVPQDAPSDTETVSDTEAYDSSPTRSQVYSDSPATPQPVQPALPVTLIWAGGCLAAFGYGGVMLMRSRRLIQGSSLIRDERVVGIANRLGRELQLGPPRMRLSPGARCPMVAGWFRPVLLLPEGFLREANDAQLTMAVAHEMAHLKRRDLWLACVPALAQTIFYFHPLAWLAVRECGVACEEACDLEALRLADGSPSAYARLLIQFAQGGPSVAALGAALSFRLLKRRIHMLRSATSHSRHLARRSATALIALGVVCAIPWNVSAQSAVATSTSSGATPTQAVSVTQAASSTSASGTTIATPAKPLKPAKKLTKAQRAHHLRAMKLLAAKDKAAKAKALLTNRTLALSLSSNIRNAERVSSVLGVATPASMASTVSRPSTIDTPAVAVGPAGSTSVEIAGQYVAGIKVVDARQKIYRVDFENVELTSAITVLMKQAGVDFVIKSTVIHEQLACCVKTGTINEILQTLLSSATQNISWRMEDGAYIIEPNQR